MPTSNLFQKCYRLKGIKVKSVDSIGNQIEIYGVPKKKYKCCTKCKSQYTKIKEKKKRRLQLPNFGSIPCYLILEIYRLECLNCKRSFSPSYSFMMGKARYTRAFHRFVLDLLCDSTISKVAKRLKRSWDCIKNIHKAWLKNKYRRIQYHRLKYIGIDEISIRKGINT